MADTRTSRFDPAIATEIIQQTGGARPELLVQILVAFVDRYGYVSEEAVRYIADALNLSRAEVHGVVSFYHDFRSRQPGRHIVKVCQAEACQSMGSRELTERAERLLGVGMNETSADGRVTLEPVYCLGNCACSPAVMIDGKVFGRVSGERLDEIVNASGVTSA